MNPNRKIPPTSDEHRTVAGKKDTKRWCRGKVGVEHEKQWILDRRYDHWPMNHPNWYNLQCMSCGKLFEYCTPYMSEHDKCKCGHHELHQ